MKMQWCQTILQFEKRKMCRTMNNCMQFYVLFIMVKGTYRKYVLDQFTVLAQGFDIILCIGNEYCMGTNI